MSGKRNWGDNMFHRNDGKEPPPVIESAYKVPSKTWKKHYKCKKNKGEHTPVIDLIKYCGRGWKVQPDGTWVHEDNYLGYLMGQRDMPYGWVEWRCTACNKKMLEWQVPEKKFDKYRP